MDLQTSAAAEFNFTGPSSVMLAASNIFHVDVYLPAPISDAVFEAFTPAQNFTDVVTLCSIAVVGVGSNFDCLPYEQSTYTLYPSASGRTDEYGRLGIGPVLNAGQCVTLRYVTLLSYYAAVLIGRIAGLARPSATLPVSLTVPYGLGTRQQ